jgi:hypothetical protein
LVQRYICSIEVCVTSCQYRSVKLVRNFSNTLAWLCEFVPLYLTTTFSFSQVHHQIDQNKCIIIELKLFRFSYINILREIIENNFPFSPEFGRPKVYIFCSRGIPGRLDALLAKSLDEIYPGHFPMQYTPVYNHAH